MTRKSTGWVQDLARRNGLERVPMQRGNAGHLTLDGRVEGTPVRLIVDTGASHTMLDQVAANRAGVGPESVEPADEGCGAGAGGNVDVSFAPVSALKLASVDAGPVTVGLLDLAGVNRQLSSAGDPPVHGVLGGDVLRRHEALVDLANDALYLRP